MNLLIQNDDTAMAPHSPPGQIKKAATDHHAEASPLNCLRCRHCEVRPETDFSKAMKLDSRGLTVANPDAIIPIYCGKTNRLRPAHIFTTCAIADGRYHAACRAVASKNTGSSPEGDRCKFVSGPERVFLRLHWELGDIHALAAATLRSAKSLNKLGRRYDLPPRSRLAILEGVRSGLKGGRTKVTGPRFTPEQKAFVQECLAAGHWPKKGNSPRIHAANAEVKAEILARIAELGYAFGWESVQRHSMESQPGAKRRRKVWDNKTRRKGVYVLPGGSPAPQGVSSL